MAHCLTNGFGQFFAPARRLDRLLRFGSSWLMPGYDQRDKAAEDYRGDRPTSADKKLANRHQRKLA